MQKCFWVPIPFKQYQNTSGCNTKNKVLNIQVLITQRSEYARICPDRVLNISGVLYMSRFWIQQGSEYVSYNAQRKVTLQVNEYLLRNHCIQNPCKDLRKIIVAFKYFPKHSILNLWEGSENVSGFKHFRVLNIPGLSICQGCEFLGLHRFYLFP